MDRGARRHAQPGEHRVGGPLSVDVAEVLVRAAREDHRAGDRLQRAPAPARTIGRGRGGHERGEPLGERVHQDARDGDVRAAQAPGQRRQLLPARLVGGDRQLQRRAQRPCVLRGPVQVRLPGARSERAGPRAGGPGARSRSRSASRAVSAPSWLGMPEPSAGSQRPVDAADAHLRVALDGAAAASPRTATRDAPGGCAARRPT